MTPTVRVHSGSASWTTASCPLRSSSSTRGARDDGEAEADLDRALDRLDVVELGDAAHRDAVRAQDAVDRPARRDVALEEDEVLILQIGGAQFFAPRERVARRADEHEAVALERDDFEAALLLGEGDDAQLDRAVEHVAHDARRARVFEVDLGLRVARHELAHRRRQLVQADAVHGRHAHRPAHRPGQRPHALFQLRRRRAAPRGSRCRKPRPPASNASRAARARAPAGAA